MEKEIKAMKIATLLQDCGICYFRATGDCRVSSVSAPYDAGINQVAFVRTEDEARRTYAECVVSVPELKPYLSRVRCLVLVAPQKLSEAENILMKELQ